MPLIAYLDESGDHSLDPLDANYPLFVLALFICDTAYYAETLVPQVYKLKMDFWGHEMAILRSRNIRKAEGRFSILLNEPVRRSFIERLTRLMAETQYQVIASVIRKGGLKDRYGTQARNPYDLALKFAMERLLPLLEEVGQDEVNLIAESRGRREDRELEESFGGIVENGTEYVDRQRFGNIRFHLQIQPKAANVVGIQLADLCAYPIGRAVLDPDRSNRAFEVLKPKIYTGPGAIYGLKVFP